jgi:outer membrane immunogenic protein
MLRNILLSSVALVAVTSASFAADLPSRKAPPVAYVSAPIFTWTGFYVGGNVGAVFSNSSNITERAPAIGGDVAYNGTGFSAPIGSKTSVIGGLQAGYNFQFSSIVLGIEADIDATGYNSSGAVRNLAGVVVGAGDTLGAKKANWLGTVRGRLGVAFFDRGLIYVTGGAAFSDLKYSVVDSCAGAPCGPALASGSATVDVGYAVGGGIEYAFSPSWSVKGEYLYSSFGGKTFRTTNVPASTTLYSTGRTDLHQVRVGVNYHFGAPAAAVVAKY